MLERKWLVEAREIGNERSGFASSFWIRVIRAKASAVVTAYQYFQLTKQGPLSFRVVYSVVSLARMIQPAIFFFLPLSFL